MKIEIGKSYTKGIKLGRKHGYILTVETVEDFAVLERNQQVVWLVRITRYYANSPNFEGEREYELLLDEWMAGRELLGDLPALLVEMDRMQAVYDKQFEEVA